MEKRSKVSKNTIIAILFLELPIVAGILFSVINAIRSNCFEANTIACIITLILLVVFIPIIIKPSLKISFQTIEDLNQNIEYVNQHLSEENWVEVIPIKDEPEHDNFLTKELCKRAKFYAIIMNDGTVCISLQFNGEENMVYYGGMQASDFANYFKVLDL